MSDQPDPAGSPAPTGLLSRLAGSLMARFGSAAAVAVPAADAAEPSGAAAGDAPHPLLQAHADKLSTAAEAVQAVRPGDHVFVGTACATPRTLVAAVEALGLADVEMLHFLTDHAVAHDEQGLASTQLRHRSLFVGQDMRAAVRQGLADYVPVSLVRVPGLMAIGRIPVDVALIQVSMPDAFGFVSLGVSVDVVAAAVAHARVVIAEVNPQMPRSMGDSMLHISRIQHLVLVDTPVIEYVHPATSAPAMQQIARYIGSLIDDGSTLQIGLGRVANEALRHLSDRRDLGIHSDVITDAIIPLLENGSLNGRSKSQQAGKIVTSFAMGSRRLYDLIDGNPLFSFQPIEAVCDPATLALQHKLVSVTQAFAIDLTGQVCADQFNGEFYGGMAAQAEFLQGASRSPGGKAIVCLAATDDDGRTSRIRPVLLAGEGVTIPRSEVHFVVTEFGIAYLFGKSIRERAVALIQIAHPDSRPALFEQAQALGYLPAHQKLRNLRAYAVEDEATLRLKDQRELLLRPVTPTDVEGIRQLFHRLSVREVYTRFFRKLRGLTNQDVQRLCNLDYDNEVALVAVTGTREQPVICGHAMYVVDPSTNLAETAFIVHPDWQGQGLGIAMQKRLAELAVARGVRGFVAEMLAGNEAMIRLAQTSAAEVQTVNLGGSVQITALFDTGR
jgi:acyl-CoA hydrolase/RimJ/RimL family protein N-acetyltransferase